MGDSKLSNMCIVWSFKNTGNLLTFGFPCINTVFFLSNNSPWPKFLEITPAMVLNKRKPYRLICSNLRRVRSWQFTQLLWQKFNFRCFTVYAPSLSCCWKQSWSSLKALKHKRNKSCFIALQTHLSAFLLWFNNNLPPTHPPKTPVVVVAALVVEERCPFAEKNMDPQ